MSLARTTAANTSWLLAAQVVTRASGFLVAVLLARTLGAGGFGVYAFVCAYVGFFAFLTDMGMDVYITREASCDLKGSEQIAGTGIVVKVFLSLLAFALSVGTALLIGMEGSKVVLIGIASSGMLLAPLTLYGVAFSATLRFHYAARFEIFGKLLLVLLLVSVLFTTRSLPVVFVALVLPGAVVAALNVWYGRKLFRPEPAFDWQASKRLVLSALPIALGFFCIQVLMRIDQVMLEWLRGDVELGLYSTGVKCCEALYVLPAILTTAVFPILSRAAREGRESDLLTICSRCFKVLALALSPLVLLMFLYPQEILSLLFGEAFSPGASALRILCWSAPLVAMGYIVMCAAVSSNRLHAMLNLSVWLAVSNTLLNLLLIPAGAPLGGGNGAALATLLSLTGLLGLAQLHVGLRPIVVEFLRNSVKPALSLVPPALLLFLHPLPLFAGIPVCLVFYGCTVLLTGGVGKDDLDFIRKGP